MEEKGSKVIGGSVFPRQTRAKGSKCLKRDPVTGLGVWRGVFLAFQIEGELPSEKVFRRDLAAP